jgi:proteasome lid subunit RPN8/RPN11
MRWQDQSEALTLPPIAAFLATLDPSESARFDQPDNTHPRVAITQACLDAIMLHLNASRDELGGLLVGQAYAGVDGTPRIIAAIHGVESRAFDSTGVSLRMETEVWNSARPFLDRGAAVVGWYHSHPDLGAFFSDTDRATQRSFFRQAFSIGIVIDPVRKELKAFLGPECAEIPFENVIVTAVV